MRDTIFTGIDVAPHHEVRFADFRARGQQPWLRLHDSGQADDRYLNIKSDNWLCFVGFLPRSRQNRLPFWQLWVRSRGFRAAVGTA